MNKNPSGKQPKTQYSIEELLSFNNPSLNTVDADLAQKCAQAKADLEQKTEKPVEVLGCGSVDEPCLQEI